MKNRTKSINALKVEIEELEKTIALATRNRKIAFARRLKMIKEEKELLLERWIINN